MQGSKSDGIPQDTDPLNLNLHHITFLQRPHSGRRARRNHITRLQGHDAADVGEQRRNREHHLRGTPPLALAAVAALASEGFTVDGTGSGLDGIHRALAELAVRVPDDVELIGFGDDVEAAVEAARGLSLIDFAPIGPIASDVSSSPAPVTGSIPCIQQSPRTF